MQTLLEKVPWGLVGPRLKGRGPGASVRSQLSSQQWMCARMCARVRVRVSHQLRHRRGGCAQFRVWPGRARREQPRLSVKDPCVGQGPRSCCMVGTQRKVPAAWGPLSHGLRSGAVGDLTG